MSKEKKNASAAKAEAVYTVSELAQEAKRVFGKEMNPDCVMAALKMSGKKEATVNEAKKLVAAFLKKEVK